MALIGITGTPAAGKTAALEAFAALGMPTADADSIVHELYRRDSTVRHCIRERWGPAAFTEDGSINRAWIAARVFDAEQERVWLNALLHPRVRQRLLEGAERSAPLPLYCAVPLLFEVGWAALMSAVCTVWCPPELQVERLRRRGWTAKRIEQCIAAQLAADVKLERADFGLINSGSRHCLQDQCRRVRERIQAGLAGDRNAGR